MNRLSPFFGLTREIFSSKNARRFFFLPLIITALMISDGQLLAQSQLYDLYVSSAATNSVKLYNGETGAYIKDFVAAGAGGLDDTQEVVFGPDGHLYVTGFRNNRIKKYNGQTGEFIENFSKNYSLVNPAKMTFRYEDGLIYVSQWGGSRKVARFRIDDGEFVDEFTSVGVPGNCGFAWDSDGNLYVAGWGSNGNDGLVQKFDTSGVLMQTFIPTSAIAGPVNCWFGENGDLFVQDWTRGNIERFSADGTSLGTYISNLVRTEGYDWDEHGDLYLCDWFQHRINRYDPQGNFLGIFADGGGLDTPNGLVFGPKYMPVGIEDDETLPQVYELSQNYPNPFNPSTTVRFAIPEAARVSIELYTVLGHKIRTLVDRQMTPGWHSINIDGSDLASGIYLYRIRANDYSDVKKMILMK